MRRVLIVIEEISIGGFGNSLVNLLRTMDNDEYSVDVGLLDYHNGGKEKIEGLCNCLNLSKLKRCSWSKPEKVLRVLSSRHGIFIIASIMNAKMRKRKVFRGMKASQMCEMLLAEHTQEIDLSQEYDVVISWCEMYPNYLLANKINVKNKIGLVHPDYLQAKFSREVDLEPFSKLDMLLAVSAAGENSLKKVFPEYADKISHFHNKLSVNTIETMANEYDVKFDKSVFNIVTVARLQNVSKGFERVVRCARKLADAGYSFVWHIIGDGEDRADIERDIRKLGLEEHFVLYGIRENPFPYVKQADLFALCSYYEGFPVAVDEAVALCVPCFVTRYAAADEQIQDSFGYVVDNSDSGIVNGLKQVLDDRTGLEEKRNFLKSMDKSYFSDCSDFYSAIDRCIRNDKVIVQN